MIKSENKIKKPLVIRNFLYLKLVSLLLLS